MGCRVLLLITQVKNKASSYLINAKVLLQVLTIQISRINWITFHLIYPMILNKTSLLELMAWDYAQGEKTHHHLKSPPFFPLYPLPLLLFWDQNVPFGIVPDLHKAGVLIGLFKVGFLTIAAACMLQLLKMKADLG